MIKVIFLLLGTVSLSQAQIQVDAFLSEIFSEMPYVRDLAVSENGKELFFTVDDYKHNIGFITTITRKRKKWSTPEIVSFSGRYRDIEPFLSYDGKRMYFASNRPVDGNSEDIKDYDLWYVERSSIGAAWSDAIWLDSTINSSADEYYPSVTQNGDLYFTSAREGSVGTEDIFVAAYRGGQYEAPVSVTGGVNSASYEFNAFVAPDASYMLFTSYRERDGRKRSDLYISQRAVGDAWGPAQLIPGIYSNAIDYCPFVDAKGSRMYFTSERNSIPSSYKRPLNFQEFMDEVHKNPNGSGRIYSVDFKQVLQELETVE